MKVHIGPYRKNRKVSVRIDKYDTWNMDCTLAMIIHPMLVQLKATKHGSPYIEIEDLPEHLRELDGEDAVHVQWDWVLDEMIWAFEQIVNCWEDTSFEDSEEMQTLFKSNRDEWFTKIKEHEARIANGTRLFGVYFRGLWD